MAFVGRALERALPFHSFSAVVFPEADARTLGPRFTFSTVSMAKEMREYLDHYIDHNPLAPLVEPGSGEMFLLTDHLTRLQRDRNPFAAEHLAGIGVTNVIMAGHRLPDGSVFRFGISIGPRRSEFTSRERRLLAAVNDDIARAAFDPVELLTNDENVAGIVQFDASGEISTIDVSAQIVLRRAASPDALVELSARARALIAEGSRAGTAADVRLPLENGDSIPVRLLKLDARSGRGALGVLYSVATSRRRLFDDAQLTGRQREVADLVARGASNLTIANALGLGGDTVKFHLKAVFKKCGVSSRAELAALITGSL